MKLNNLFYLAAASLMMVGCGDDWNEDKLEGFGKPEVTDIKSLDITLQAADYSTIASNSTNKALAEAAGLSSALSKLKSNQYFTDELPASTYLPAFLAATYPTADDRSSVRVTYNQLVGEPSYLKAYSEAECLEMGDEAYEQVWGDKVQAFYLTPKTENQIPKLLKTSFPDSEAGQLALVSYAYSDVEPSIGGGGSEEKEPTWTQLSFPKRASGTNWNFVNVGPIDLSDYKGNTVHIGFRYTSDESVYAKWELSNFKAFSLPYLDVLFFKKQDDGSFKKIIKTSEFAAGEYVIASMIPGGNYNLVSALSASKNYGYMPVKAIDHAGDLISADEAEGCILTFEAVDGGYTMKAPDGRYMSNDTGRENYSLVDEMKDGNYVWSVSVIKNSDAVELTNVATGNTMKLNYYAKGNSYSFGCYSESKLINACYVMDDEVLSTYDKELGNLEAVWTYDTKYSCWVASSKTAQVTESFLVSPAIEITEDAALPYFTVDEAFRFAKSDASDLTLWISTDYTSASSANTRALTRGVAQSNKTVLFEFDGTNWTKATVDEGTLAVLQPADYDQMDGNIDLEKYADIHYPYAQADDVLVVVYALNNQAYAKELTFDGTNWALTSSVATKTDQFVRASGKWNYDPSVTIELPAGKGQALSTLYFQTATDWVWEHIDQPKGYTTKGQGYVTSYGNNEYYCGCSAYQGNVDWRASAAKAQYPSEYNTMSDDQVKALMQQRFIEVMKGTLEVIHSDAVPVEGVTVTYTINFAVYTGSTSYWTIRYVVTAPGKFEYVADSLLQVE